jgi:excisionase family DNA binding protein
MVINSRISVAEIALRLSVGRLTVYKLLENGVIPSIRFGHRYLVTRRAYEAWEQTCGKKPAEAA